MLEQQRLSEHPSNPTWPEKLGQGDDQVDEENESELHAESAWSIVSVFVSLHNPERIR